MHAFYNDTDRRRFADYFGDGKKQVGRPRKKKRRYNKKKKAKAKAKAKEQKRKSLDVLDDKCAGEVAKAKLNKPKRLNWDIEPNFSYRERVVTSWMCQVDLWRVGEKFCRFATRCGIDRNVLTRYMEKLKNTSGSNKTKPRGEKRGRKPMLPVTVMHHLCEG
jgi:hypothetical protein